MKLIRVKDRKEVLDALKTVYGAENAAQAEAALDAFCEKYGKRYPKLTEKFSDRRSLFSFFKYPKKIRQSLYTTKRVCQINCNKFARWYAKTAYLYRKFDTLDKSG